MILPLSPEAAEAGILLADNSLIIAWKPHRLHTAPLPDASGPSLAAWVFERFPDAGPEAFGETGAGRRRGEAGLLHRLDFETAGLVLFARNPQSLERLLAAQKKGRIAKYYRLEAAARVEGLPGSRPPRFHPAGIDQDSWDASLAEPASLAGLLAGRRIEGRFRAFGPRGGRVACLAPEEVGERRRRGSPIDTYRTDILEAEASGRGIAALVRLTRGFRHQIRAHFAWLALPLLGDSLYGGEPASTLKLLAMGFEFDHPATGEPLVLRLAIE
jgi:23S rRNA pseudouridine1911/1915/1917 synthase